MSCSTPPTPAAIIFFYLLPSGGSASTFCCCHPWLSICVLLLPSGGSASTFYCCHPVAQSLRSAAVIRWLRVCDLLLPSGGSESAICCCHLPHSTCYLPLLSSGPASSIRRRLPGTIDQLLSAMTASFVLLSYHATISHILQNFHGILRSHAYRPV